MSKTVKRCETTRPKHIVYISGSSCASKVWLCRTLDREGGSARFLDGRAGGAGVHLPGHRADHLLLRCGSPGLIALGRGPGGFLWGGEDIAISCSWELSEFVHI